MQKLSQSLLAKLHALPADTCLSDAIEYMQLHGVSYLLLQGDEQHACFSNRDALYALSASVDLSVAMLSDWAKPIVTIDDESMPAIDLLQLMVAHQQHALLLLEDDKPKACLHFSEVLAQIDLQSLLANAQLSDFTHQTFLSLPQDASLQHALNCMLEHQSSSVLVCEQGKAVGLLSDRDLALLALRWQSVADAPLKHFMSHPVLSIHKHADLLDAAYLMSRHRLRRLVVCDDEQQVFGLLGQNELYTALQKALHTQNDVMLSEPPSQLKALAFEDISGFALLQANAQQQLQFVSEQMADLLSIPQQALLSMSLSAIFDEGFQVFSDYLSMKQQRQPVSLMRSYRQQGETRYYTFTLLRQYDEQQRVRAYLLMAYQTLKPILSDSDVHASSQYDSATGLPNRLLMMDRLLSCIEVAKRQNKAVAVLFLSLKNFHYVNESWGHSAGDQVLKEVAQRLITTVRESDSVGRFSGDQFLLLLPNLSKNVHLEGALQKIMSAFEQPFLIQQGQDDVCLDVGIGISMFPDDGSEVASLMRMADIAAHRSKLEAGSHYCFFNESMMGQSLQRMRMEHELRHALERSEFEVYFQPIVNDEGDLVGAEALLRWNHPVLGSVSPERFIPLAEEVGLICDIGAWVLHRSCLDAVGMMAAIGKSLLFSVNVSSHQFRGSRLIDDVHSALACSGLPVECLELEVTEGVLLEDRLEVQEILMSLKDMGVRLALDDFGTGYSSLSYLKKYPFHSLKVDRSFVSNLLGEDDDSRNLVRAILAMAQGLSLKSTGEGVELTEQFDFLRDEGCQRIQGYLFSKPLSADDFMCWAKQSLNKAAEEP